MSRKHVLSANTQFTCAQFFPTAVQILATGTDRKISYWEVFDGSLVRHVVGSAKGCINWLSINCSGEMFISGGDDQVIKVFYTFYNTNLVEFQNCFHKIIVKFIKCVNITPKNTPEKVLFTKSDNCIDKIEFRRK